MASFNIEDFVRFGITVKEEKDLPWDFYSMIDWEEAEMAEREDLFNPSLLPEWKNGKHQVNLEKGDQDLVIHQVALEDFVICRGYIAGYDYNYDEQQEQCKKYDCGPWEDWEVQADFRVKNLLELADSPHSMLLLKPIIFADIGPRWNRQDYTPDGFNKSMRQICEVCLKSNDRDDPSEFRLLNTIFGPASAGLERCHTNTQGVPWPKRHFVMNAFRLVARDGKRYLLAREEWCVKTGYDETRFWWQNRPELLDCELFDIDLDRLVH